MESDNNMKMKNTKETDIKIPVRKRAQSFATPLSYKVISDEEINLTRKRAFEFLESNAFIGERTVREGHVQHLYDEWLGGRFIWQHVILSVGVLKDVTYRLNGQHTCWMRVNIPESQDPGPCKVRLIAYRVEDDEGLRSLYSTFDRNAPRTSCHISKIMLMQTEAGATLQQNVLSVVTAGFRLFLSDQPNKMPVDETVGLIKHNYSTLFNIVGRFHQMHRRAVPWSARAAALAGMWATFEKNVMASETFWTSVFTGLNLPEKSDPRWQLRNWFLTHNQSTTPGQIRTTAEESYRACLYLWNRWRSNEPVLSLHVPTARLKAKE